MYLQLCRKPLRTDDNSSALLIVRDGLPRQLAKSNAGGANIVIETASGVAI